MTHHVWRNLTIYCTTQWHAFLNRSVFTWILLLSSIFFGGGFKTFFLKLFDFNVFRRQQLHLNPLSLCKIFNIYPSLRTFSGACASASLLFSLFIHLSLQEEVSALLSTLCVTFTGPDRTEPNQTDISHVERKQKKMCWAAWFHPLRKNPTSNCVKDSEGRLWCFLSRRRRRHHLHPDWTV